MKKLLIILLTAIMLLSVSGCNSDVHEVEKMIDNIGEIEPTLKCKKALNSIRQSYNNLSSEQQSLVKNIDDLGEKELVFCKEELLQSKIVSTADDFKINMEQCKNLCEGYLTPDFTSTYSDIYLKGIETLKTVNSTIEDNLSDLEKNYSEIHTNERQLYHLLEIVYEKYKPLYELAVNPSGEYPDYSIDYKTKFEVCKSIYDALEEEVRPIRAQNEELKEDLLAPYEITE